MTNDLTPSGIAAVGPIRWGDHFCQFYESAADLRDSLVPYFSAGLANDEKCLWVTSEPFGEDDAAEALRAAVPSLDDVIAKGQIEIVDYRRWYLRQETLAPEEVVRSWLGRAAAARDEGYRGLRLTGNTFWLQAPQWRDFAEYEATVNAGFRGRPIVALCSYCLDRCHPAGVLDVVRNHQFALTRRNGEWEVIENASLKIAKQELATVNAELERRVAERTAALSAALAEKDVLFREIHHRVKNNLQVIASLLSLKARSSRHEGVAETLRELRNRVYAMALVHQQLYGSNAAAIDFGAYLPALCASLSQASATEGRIAVSVDAEGVVPLEEAVPLGLIATELVSNALRHAFPDSRRGAVAVRFRSDDALTLCVRDDGVGLSDPAGHGGLGIVRAIVGQLGATLSFAQDRGTVATVYRPRTLPCGHRQH